MGEGKANGEARADVGLGAVDDMQKWDTGTPKNPGDPATQGQYTGVSDANADAGADTSPAQQVSSTLDPRPQGDGGSGSPSAPGTFGSMRDGLPASGATVAPDETADPEKSS